MSEPKRYTPDWRVAGTSFVPTTRESSDGEYIRYEDYARLKAEVERLTKAGDWLVEAVQTDDCWENWDKGIAKWNAAKKGGQP